jgi:hypothetical protein
VPLTKLVCGGQTGVDRGALDAALEAGFPCGGWCPAGRTAEDGPIPQRYPLVEVPGGGYRERTIRNVRDSDGTLVIFFGALKGGTEETVSACVRQHRPYRLIDGAEIAPTRAAELAAEFVAENGVSVLNVAGPRSSQSPTAYAYAHEAIGRLLCGPNEGSRSGEA